MLIEPLIAEPIAAESGAPVSETADTAPAAAQPAAEPRRRGSRRASSPDGTSLTAGGHVNAGETGVESLIPDVDAQLDSALASREQAPVSYTHLTLPTSCSAGRYRGWPGE